MVGMAIGKKYFRKAGSGRLPLPGEDKLMPGGPYHQEGSERGLKYYPTQNSQILSPPRFSFITSSSTDSIE